jgi:probable rRNA maturation factor
MIVNRQRRVAIAIKPLADFCQRVRRELRFPENGVTVCLISDAVMAQLNHTFRGKNTSTDVLSFPAMPLPPKRSAGKASRNGPNRGHRLNSEYHLNREYNTDRDACSYVGDIAISPETAQRNARRSSRTLTAELRILILHGMIHLAGYDHETDAGQMEKFERRLRRRFGLPR